mmetsp:Transcript_8956/g.21834  ORF Transcript_8956/g.21834 Transcript_8956/m.21834 type:complete len:219 (-) Transcript_8956:458-1114(-)
MWCFCFAGRTAECAPSVSMPGSSTEICCSSRLVSSASKSWTWFLLPEEAAGDALFVMPKDTLACCCADSTGLPRRLAVRLPALLRLPVASTLLCAATGTTKESDIIEAAGVTILLRPSFVSLLFESRYEKSLAAPAGDTTVSGIISVMMCVGFRPPPSCAAAGDTTSSCCESSFKPKSSTASHEPRFPPAPAPSRPWCALNGARRSGWSCPLLEAECT